MVASTWEFFCLCGQPDVLVFGEEHPHDVVFFQSILCGFPWAFLFNLEQPGLNG